MPKLCQFSPTWHILVPCRWIQRRVVIQVARRWVQHLSHLSAVQQLVMKRLEKIWSDQAKSLDPFELTWGPKGPACNWRSLFRALQARVHQLNAFTSTWHFAGMQVVQGFPKTQPTQELSGNPSNSSIPSGFDIFLIPYRQKCKFLAELGTPPRPHVEEQEDHLDQAPWSMLHHDAESI